MRSRARAATASASASTLTVDWADVGWYTKTLARFYGLLGHERSSRIESVSADAASWVAKVIQERCPQALPCSDPYHIVTWANEALDRLRLTLGNEAREEVAKLQAEDINGDRYVVCNNPEKRTDGQKDRLSAIETFKSRSTAATCSRRRCGSPSAGMATKGSPPSTAASLGRGTAVSHHSPYQARQNHQSPPRGNRGGPP
jgi:transposase